MDLEKFEIRGKEARLELEFEGKKLTDDATGEPVWISLVSAESKEYAKLQHQHTTKRIQKGFRRGKVVGWTGEAIDDDNMELMVAVTKGWGNVVYKGEALTCTPENVKRVYSSLRWVFEQVWEFVHDPSNFLGN